MKINNLTEKAKVTSINFFTKVKNSIDNTTPSMAIILAGVLVSLTIFLTVYEFFGGKNIQIQIRPVPTITNQVRQNIPPMTNPAIQNPRQIDTNNTVPTPTYPTITPADHTTGSLNSKISVIEYSDLNSQDSYQLYTNLDKVYSEYSKNNTLVWAFRHLLSNASSSILAEASECANELGGKSKFWSYIDKVFTATGIQKNLDRAGLIKLASSISLDQKKFQTCLDSGKYRTNIEKMSSDSRLSGIRNNPTATLIYKNKEGQTKTINIEGPAKYENIKSIIDNILKQLK
jgi:predicted DsbA family dithiol-disulfide isomerase